MIYQILFKSRGGVCPKCGGALMTCNSNEVIVHCIDCSSYYKAINNGQSESELQFEEVSIGH